MEEEKLAKIEANYKQIEEDVALITERFELVVGFLHEATKERDLLADRLSDVRSYVERELVGMNDAVPGANVIRHLGTKLLELFDAQFQEDGEPEVKGLDDKLHLRVVPSE